MTTKKPDFSDVRSSGSTVQGGGGTGRADFSDVRTGSSTVQGGGGSGVQSYTVESGDTLSQIAKQCYGKASKWQAIFAANRDQLDDPDLIQPGQILKIPALDNSDD